MKVRELLATFEDKHYADVVIMDGSYHEELGYNDTLAEYDHKDNIHEEWGQLDYFNSFFPNPLEKWHNYTVKHFTVINEVKPDGFECIYITI